MAGVDMAAVGMVKVLGLDAWLGKTIIKSS
jgi:hypothetical protein